MFLTAFTIGALGSFHCIGMCGPIAMAVPLGRAGEWQGVLRGVAYNSGRVITYLILGLIIGMIGERLAMGGFQQTLSVMVGVLILLAVLMPRSITSQVDPTSRISRWVLKAKGVFGSAMRSKSLMGPLSLGLMNGLLPCGLVYVGLAGALAVGNAMESALFMAAFGLGTLPMMLAVHMAGDLVSISARAKIRGMLPYAFAVMGVLFILRGMDLGIPYISPNMDMTYGSQMECN